MTLEQLTAEYNAKLEEFGVPERFRTCAYDLWRWVSWVIAGEEEPFCGEHFDYDGLKDYLWDFIQRWEEAERKEAA
jgi:hypothetical protein